MLVEKIIEKIAQHRQKKGYSYENMAAELDITAAAYRKIETGDTNLSVDRLFKIAKILDITVFDLLDFNKEFINQTNQHNENVYQQKILNIYQENREVYQELIKVKDEQILLLKELLKNKS